MTTRNHPILHMAVSALTLVAACAGNSSVAQQTPELDITINVIQSGELPDGFINRLELPALSAITETATPAAVEAEVIADTVVEAVAIADDASQAGIDIIREVISVDGTVVGSGGIGGTAGGVVDTGLVVLPQTIVDILDPTLPLADTLADTVDGIGGVVGGVVDGVVDGSVTGGVAGGVDAVINDGLTAGALNSVDTDSIVNDASTLIVDDLQDASVNDLVGEDVLAPVTDDLDPVVDVVEELPEIPGL